MLRYEENRETITRGGQIKQTYNLAFDEIQSESSAKCAKSTIPCQAEDAAETDIEERRDQFLRAVKRLLKPSARKRCHWRGKETRTGVEKAHC